MPTRVSDLSTATTFDSDDEFYVVQDGSSRKVAGAVVRGPVHMGGVSTGSGTQFDYTDLPSWVKEVSIMFNQVSLSGTNNILIQLGTASAFENTGYIGGGSMAASAAINTFGPTTNGFLIVVSSASRAVSGFATLKRYDTSSTQWHFSASCFTGSASMSINAGVKNLSTVLTRLRITRSGSDTFTGGALNVSYR